MSSISSNAPIRLCLLGCGQAARMHAKTLTRFGGRVRCLYASREPAKAKLYLQRHGGVGAFGSYEDALTSPDVDVVAVLTPPPSHLDWTLRSLRAGKDVLVEKPAFLCSGDVAEVEAACRASGRRVFVAENYLYKPIVARLRQALEERWLGDVLFIHLNAVKRQSSPGWRQDLLQAGGGALFEGGIHWIDFIHSAGLELRSLQAAAPGTSAVQMDRSVLLMLQFSSGAVGTLAYSWEVHSPLRGLRLSRIYGREGSLVFESNGLFFAAYGKRWRLGFPGLRDIQGYHAMFEDFLRAWHTGQEPRMSLAQARRDLEVVEAAHTSLRSGLPVQFQRE